MNREAVDAIRLGFADGLQDEAEVIIGYTANLLPDLPPLGKGLKFSGAAVTYVDGKKVSTGRGTAPRGAKPRGIGTVLGFGWPGLWRELGNAHQPPRPTLTPAMAARVQGGMDAVPRHIKRRLAGVRSRRAR